MCKQALISPQFIRDKFLGKVIKAINPMCCLFVQAFDLLKILLEFFMTFICWFHSLLNLAHAQSAAR